MLIYRQRFLFAASSRDAGYPYLDKMHPCGDTFVETLDSHAAFPVAFVSRELDPQLNAVSPGACDVVQPQHALLFVHLPGLEHAGFVQAPLRAKLGTRLLDRCRRYHQHRNAPPRVSSRVIHAGHVLQQGHGRPVSLLSASHRAHV